MKTMAIILMFLAACASKPHARHAFSDIIGIDSFALAARYGTPASYQHLGEYLQLNYGSAAVGCKVVVLVGRTACLALTVTRQRLPELAALKMQRPIPLSVCTPPGVANGSAPAGARRALRLANGGPATSKCV